MRDVQLLFDYRDVERLAYLYGRATDSRTMEGYSLFDECLLPDVEVIYGFGTWTGLERHKQVAAKYTRTLFTFTHHVITNPLITLSGDTAIASYRSTAAHGVKSPDGDRIIYGGATYIQHCVRTSAGWRIKRHVEEDSWIDDHGELLARLMAKS